MNQRIKDIAGYVLLVAMVCTVIWAYVVSVNTEKAVDNMNASIEQMGKQLRDCQVTDAQASKLTENMKTILKVQEQQKAASGATISSGQ